MSLINRHLPVMHDPDPAVAEARAARAATAKARQIAAEEKLAHQRERQACADQLMRMLFSTAVDPETDTAERIKAANAYLDRVLPRVKSIEMQLDGVVQVSQQYVTPEARIAQLSFDEALGDAMRRLQQYDMQRGALTGDAVRIGSGEAGDGE